MRPTIIATTTLALLLAALALPRTGSAQSRDGLAVGQRSLFGGRVVLGTPQERGPGGRLLPGQRSFFGGRIVLGTARGTGAGRPGSSAGSRFVNGGSLQAGFARNNPAPMRRIGALERRAGAGARVPRFQRPGALTPRAPRLRHVPRARTN